MSAAGADPSPPLVDVVPREARPFQGQPAGVVTRTAANIVDFAVVAGVLAGGYAVWSAFRFLIRPTRFTFPTPTFLALLACFAIILFAYFTFSWVTTGRTYGDHLLGLRVVSSRGGPLRGAVAVVRAAFCVVLPIGLFWTVVSSTNRSLQDTVVRTSVLYDWTTRRRTHTHAGEISQSHPH
jgi:uncharacterized RDD family membrane protein YckC